MSVATESTGAGEPARGGKAMTWLSKLFEVHPAGLNWPRAVAFLDAALVPMFVFWAIGHEEYLLSALFGLLFAALADPGGGYGHRALHVSVFALTGAGVTALAFGVGSGSWGLLTCVSFAVTLAAGLMAAFGARRFVNALLLNVWFVVAVGFESGIHQEGRITSHVWAQVLSWTGGALLWITVAFLWWLVRGRTDRDQPFSELPGDTSRKGLTRPLVLFALIRALVIGGTVALAFGLDLSYGYWIPIAAIVALKPSLEQAALAGAQRLVGASIGAVVAALLLWVPAGEHGLRLFAVHRGLEVVALVLLMHGAGIRFWNYTLYTAAIAAGVLVLIDLPQPSDDAAEGYRVLWTLCGAGTSLIVMLLAGLLARRTAGTPSPSV
ncbi:FUSC family protein [Streptomyces ardesiacus]|uniref:FUSC family protein n=1 Tax=Streptomyces ardesiacus TaxID=285564 RepID=UPI00365865B3